MISPTRGCAPPKASTGPPVGATRGRRASTARRRRRAGYSHNVRTRSRSMTGNRDLSARKRKEPRTITAFEQRAGDAPEGQKSAPHAEITFPQTREEDHAA